MKDILKIIIPELEQDMKHIAKTVTTLMLFLITTALGQSYTVSGVVTLEDQTGGSADHSGIKIRFVNLPSGVPEDSTTSTSNGAYSISIAPGYYLVEWTKSGYVPEELGGLVLTANKILDDVTMIPGSVQEISGTVNTATWTTSNVFYVTGNCTIPSGQTLTINAGVRVKFSTGKRMLVSGKIIANGTSSSRIIFTSRESVPTPGDWEQILIKGTDSQLSYFDYLYAGEPLEVSPGDVASNTVINNGYFNYLEPTTSAIKIQDGGGETITNNNIRPGDDYYGIWANNSEDGGGVTITGNTVTGWRGIFVQNSDSSKINSNTIVASRTGIYTNENDYITISQNNITGQVQSYGIYVDDGGNNSSGVGYNGNNSTTNPSDYDVVITNNYIKRTDNNITCCPNSIGIYKWSGNYGTLIKGNTVIFNDSTATNVDYMSQMSGIWAYRSLIDSNYVELDGRPHQCGNVRVVYGQTCDITRNTIKATTGDGNCDWDRYVLYAYNDQGADTILIQNNKITSKYGGGEQWYNIFRTSSTNHFKVIGNTFKIDGTTIGQGMFRLNDGVKDYYNNDLEVVGPGHTDGETLIYYGGGSTDTTVFRSSTFSITNTTNLSPGSWDFMESNDSAPIKFYKNTVSLNGLIRGISLENTKGSIHNNTMVTTAGDYGLYFTNSNIVIKNNNFVGFTTSVYNENSSLNFNINNNNTWDTSTPFSGTGLPPAIGSLIGVNANGTASDIYDNISKDPVFVHADTGNYNIQSSSPLVNAGDASSASDPDGSVSDIGAHYYHIYVAMGHTPLTFTNNTSSNYRVKTKVTSTSGSSVTATMSYSLNGGSYTTVNTTSAASDTFYADIPAQALNTRVQYYVTGTDGTNTSTIPRDMTNGGHEFYVTLFSNFSTIGMDAESDGDIALSWGTPTPISGTVTGYKVYKDDEPNVSLSSANLLAGDIASDATGYTDSGVLEGHTFYYKVVGVLSSGSESLIGPETSGTSNSSTKMRLRGIVHLSGASADAPDHSGAKVLLSAMSPSAQSDSLTTGLTGEIDVVMNNGLYNIYFSRSGYQTRVLGNIFLAANMVLDTVTLQSGGMAAISGEISGTLSGDTLYSVNGDLTVPSGQTLTIEAGSQLAFNGEYSLTANGKLLVNGTAANRVSFTSGSINKSGGDWTGIVINNSGSRISYADIKYSSSTIYVAAVDTVTINNCLISENSSGSHGIRIDDELKYFTIRENTIRATSGRGIYKVSGNNSDDGNSENRTGGAEIVGNTIYSKFGIRLYATWNARVDSNTFWMEDQGDMAINNSYSQNSSYKHNLIAPQDQFGYYHNGLELMYVSNSIIHGNQIKNCKDRAVDIRAGKNDTISQNIITRDWSCDNDDNFTAFHLTETAGNNYVYKNTIDVHNGLEGADNDGHGYRRTYGFIGVYGSENNYNNKYIKNKVTIGTTYDDNSAHNNRGFTRLGNDVVLKGNKITVYNYTNSWSENDEYSRASSQAIIFSPNGSVTSTNDTLITSDRTMGIYAKDLQVAGTVIRNSQAASYNYFKGIYTTGSLTADGVTITGMRYPVYHAGSGNSTIKNSTLVPYADNGFTATSSSASATLERVTIIGPGSGTGVSLPESGTSLSMNSCVVNGFSVGIGSADQPTLFSNSFYNNTNNFITFTNSAGYGTVGGYNINGDPADIYSNIYMDPLFVDIGGGDYRPTSASPLVNAGAAAELDLDGTVADIGREFYNYGYAPMNLSATSIQSGSVSIGWEIVATDSLTGYQPYYKQADSETWLYDPTAATSETNTVYSGLTNNTLYDFAVTAEYNSGSTISNRSPVLKERPGVTTMVLSPKHLVVIQDQGGSTTENYTVSNPGSRNLSATIDLVHDLGTTTFTKTNYADWSLAVNQDRITDNVWITRRNHRGLINIINESEYDQSTRVAPTGTEWAWGPTISSMSYDTWYQLKQTSSVGNHDPMYNNNYVFSLHLIEDDLYFDVTFHQWTRSNQGGGLSYTREHRPEYGSSGNYDQYQATIDPGGSVSRSKGFSGEIAGIHASNIAVSSDDPGNPLDSIFTLNIVGPQATMPSLHFSPIDTTNNPFYYVVGEGSIDGLTLETGDEIALFSGEICVGAGVYNGALPFLVQAYGGSPPDVPGFADGDSITVKAWDFGESRIANMSAVKIGGSKRFYSGGYSYVSITGTIYYTQEIQITSGSFNLVSSYLYPQAPSASSYFSGIAGLGIVYEDNGSAYIPEYGINTIGNVNLVEGYHLYTDGGNQTFTVSGLVIDPTGWTITLQPGQFNSIAYLHPSAMDVEVALGEIASVVSGEGGIVQDDAGNAWIPSLGVPMGNMTPGKGYQVFTTVDTVVNFTYATYSAPAARDVPKEKRPEPRYFAFTRTGAPYTIVIQSALIDGCPLETGDEVAVFDGATCVGAVVWSEDEPNVLSAWKGNDEFDLPGYQSGNQMSFQVYKHNIKKSAAVDPGYMNPAESVFDGSSYSRTALKGSPGLIPQQFALQQNYPNPFNPITKLRFDIAENSRVTMVVYNLMGQEVIRLLDNVDYEPGKYTMTWQALNNKGEQVSAGMYLVRMTASGGFTATRKMVLLK